MLRVLLTLSLFPPLAPAAPDFLSEALALREASKWAELSSLAGKELETDAAAPLPLAFLAIAQAGQRHFDDAVETLGRLADQGRDLDQPLDGLESPLGAVLNTIYGHCWANFDPAFNRTCWQALFDRFPESYFASVPASRLLMAALALGDAPAQQRLEEFFESHLEAAREAGDARLTGDLIRRYVDGYLHAGRSDAHILELATESWNDAWKSAAQSRGFEGPVTGGRLTREELLARRECELDTDDAFNTLARAQALSGLSLDDSSPLFRMEAEPGVHFEDVTASLGLAGVKETRVAAGDLDGDGNPDLCFQGRIFLNRKGRFQELDPKESGVLHAVSAVLGDPDGDGDLDILVAGRTAVHLYRNDSRKGKPLFKDVSDEAGLAAVKLTANPEGLAWVDADDDGDLDIYVAVYEEPMGTGNPDILLLNLGDGSFEDASADSGVAAAGPFCGRGVSPCDIDGDGDQEIFVSDYRLNANLLWSWNGKQLLDVAAALGVAGQREPSDGEYFGHTIGSVFGDVNGDGRLDLFSANLAHPRFVRQGFSNLSFLGIQGEGGHFQDEALERGIRFQETHSDPALVDIDNDGDLDLSLTCVYEGVPSALFQNDGSGHFTPITFRSGAVVFHGWGQAWLDWNGDGFLDVVYASAGGVHAFQNSGNDNHYIDIQLSSKGADALAFGARVEVETQGEDPQRWVRTLNPIRGTSSEDQPLVHFGLGSYSGRVEVSVLWPDTNRVEVKRPTVDRVFEFRQARKAH